MNVLRHTRDELNLCLKQNRPDRPYRDTLLRVQTSTYIWNVTNFRTYQRNIRYIMNKETLAKKNDWTGEFDSSTQPGLHVLSLVDLLAHLMCD